MGKKHTQKEINGIVWKACDSFRSTIDATQYKDYVLTMLFIKYVTDVWKDKKAVYAEKYNGDAVRIERALRNERFQVPAENSFDTLFEQRNETNLGELINIALEKLEDANRSKLERVFRNIDFNSEANLGQTKDRSRRLKNLLVDFSALDLQPSHLEGNDIIGDAYEFLIAQFASDASKRAGEFYTPGEVSTLLAKLVDPQQTEEGVVVEEKYAYRATLKEIEENDYNLTYPAMWTRLKKKRRLTLQLHRQRSAG